MKTKYYAYLLLNTNTSGIVTSWEECKNITAGSKSRYKSFKTEAEAVKWIEDGANYENKIEKINLLKTALEEGIYFDAGTGRGIGVEVRVTDKFGQSLLEKIMPPQMINQFGNYLAPEGSTNNYGELIGFYLALDLALKLNILKIFGDSKLVIDYWSKGFFKKDNLNGKTINLIEKVIEKRANFEKNNGKVNHISGDINPADLGFHR